MDALNSCLGQNTQDASWTQNWSKNCTTVVLNTSGNRDRDVVIRERINAITGRLNFDNQSVTNTNAPGREVYEALSDICGDNPVTCSQSLSNICDSVTPEDLEDPLVRRLCGCYMPEETYTDYADQFGLTRECTPLCRGSGTNDPIPYVPPGTGRSLTCQSQICLLDGNGSTICDHCSPNCFCWMTPSGERDSTESCGTIIDVGENGETLIQTESVQQVSDDNTDCGVSNKWKIGIWVVVGVIVLTIIIALLVYVFTRKKRQDTKSSVYVPPEPPIQRSKIPQVVPPSQVMQTQAQVQPQVMQTQPQVQAQFQPPPRPVQTIEQTSQPPRQLIVQPPQRTQPPRPVTQPVQQLVRQQPVQQLVRQQPVQQLVRQQPVQQLVRQQPVQQLVRQQPVQQPSVQAQSGLGAPVQQSNGHTSVNSIQSGGIGAGFLVR